MGGYYTFLISNSRSDIFTAVLCSCIMPKTGKVDCRACVQYCLLSNGGSRVHYSPPVALQRSRLSTHRTAHNSALVYAGGLLQGHFSVLGKQASIKTRQEHDADVPCTSSRVGQLESVRFTTVGLLRYLLPSPSTTSPPRTFTFRL